MEKAAAKKSTAKKPAAKASKPAGRPTLYKSEYADLAHKFCLLGATVADLARNFEVVESTIYEWQATHKGFSEAIKKGKDEADANVASRLYSRAMGYEHKAVKIASTPDGAEHITEYIERFPPETAACIFWLKNRRPDKWRDKLDTTLTGPDGGAVQHSVTVKFV